MQYFTQGRILGFPMIQVRENSHVIVDVLGGCRSDATTDCGDLKPDLERADIENRERKNEGYKKAKPLRCGGRGSETTQGL